MEALLSRPFLTGDYLSYQIIDFIPYTQDVYIRLIERVGELYWPWHIAGALLGIACVHWIYQRHYTLALAGISLSWFTVGYAFFIGVYSELNWAAHYFA